jgi:hypothetical protein
MSFPNDNCRRAGKPSAATLDERQNSLNSILLARAAHHSQNKPDESPTGRPTFVEDFLLEHSRFVQNADSKVFAGCF